MRFFKKSLLFLLFFFIFAVNLYLIAHAYVVHLVSQKQQRILAEIDGLKKPGSKPTHLPAGAAILGAMTNEIVLADGRSANLRNFFAKYRSPLYDLADHIVNVSNKYGFDYRLLPAIAMQESNLCKYAPEGSHNCWGYGIYGRQVTKFDSFEEAIETVARGLKQNYLDKGYTTPELIMSKYTPRSTGSWARSINLFITALE